MTAVELPRIPWRVPDWHADSACRLFPELDWVEAKPGSAQAFACRIVCAACPVRWQCAEDALKRGEPHGISGGLDKQDRKALAREYGFPPPTVLPDHGTNARRVKHGCDCVPCKAAHALYERERRARKRARAVWSGPLLVLVVPYKAGRGRIARPGQLLLPLDLPTPAGAEREPVSEPVSEPALPAAA
ncbi:hypothetical protein Lesp02_70590 [Lentzea sp. NBRC 105346]|uniref:WhiB family transcriptional regulator n=1 Tax=Lentzea sp. NBRC 105346 TaxID=3032205 RepID=UPI0024A54DD0|nr:WhiB family transcriptional regulator [Lentzea sp. NBRC 105346]GLZ34872.1 hypothetical protein Lesp02_70590 [Lentzea sp. NBRC 105346]